MRIPLKYLLIPCLLIYSSCIENGTEPEKNTVPAFSRTNSIFDTVFIWNTWAETLHVIDDDEVEIFLSDTSLPITLKDSIICLSPQLSDTGDYIFFALACDENEKCDSIEISLHVMPEYVTVKKIRKDKHSSPGGTIHCGQTTISGGTASTSYAEFEFNEFGYVSKFIRESGSLIFQYVYSYDSLLYPNRVTCITQNNDTCGYDSIVYDDNHNMIKGISVYSVGGIILEEDITEFEFDSEDRMTSMGYSYETQSCDVNNRCSTWTRNDLVEYQYDSEGLLVKMVHTFNGGQLEDSIVYIYNFSGYLIEEKEYSGEWMYPYKYEYDSNGLLVCKIRYHGTGEIGGKEEFEYNSEQLLIKIDDYCWNYTEYTYRGTTEYEWTEIRAIKTTATSKLVNDDTGIWKKRAITEEQKRGNVNAIVVQQSKEELEKAGKHGIAQTLRISRH